MKNPRLFGVPKLWCMLATASAVSVLGTSFAHAASTDIQVWLSLNPHNQKVFEKLVKQFNKEQTNVTVALKEFSTAEAIEPALAESAKNKKTPHLVQLDDNRDPESIANRSYILPLHTLLTKYPIKDAKWFVAADNSFMRDSKGRLLAFPYMVDVPVMYYNVDAFKKAGIEPAAPQRSWAGLQDQLVNLANKATRYCPLTTDQAVSVNLENLAAVNNQFYTTGDNGLKAAKAAPAFAFDILYVKHLSLMITWVRTELMVKPAMDSKATQRFAAKECAVLMSDSSNMGWFNDTRSLNFGVAGLPYYPEVTKKPGNPFVDGTALWATKGHPQAEEKATAQFLAWLAQPKNAAMWYQNTGYLPLTQQAFASTDNSYYKNLGHWKELVAVYEQQPVLTARGFKINNYPKIRAMFHQTLDRALNGQQPAATALSFASAQASKLMREK